MSDSLSDFGSDFGSEFVAPGARSLERACALAWPVLDEVRLGRWWLRAAGGFTARANAALVTGDPGLPVAAALDRVRAFHTGHGLVPRLQVITGDPVQRRLRAAGWRTDDDWCGPDGVEVLSGPLPGAIVPDGRVHDRPPPGWWPLAADTDEPSVAQRRVLAGYRPAGFGVTVRGGGAVAAVRGAVVGDLLHVSRLAVAQRFRRGGLATGLLAALARWGAAHGARRWVLQVTVTNEAALRLYRGLGCVASHRYRYWVPR